MACLLHSFVIMKIILVATDFSAASRNAAAYGMELATAFGAKLVLVNAYEQRPTPVTDDQVVITPEDLRRIVQRQLTAEAGLLQTERTAPVETACMAGSARDAILAMAHSTKADIIIAGMKVHGKRIRRIMGSTITALIRKSTIPLIVVPEVAKYRVPAALALAAEDASPGSLPMPVMLQDILDRFDPRLYLITVGKTPAGEVLQALDRPANPKSKGPMPGPYYAYPLDKGFTHALADFTTAHQMDMLVMIPHRHSFPGRWFHKDDTRSLAFETDIPLLILPESCLPVDPGQQTAPPALLSLS